MCELNAKEIVEISKRRGERIVGYLYISFWFILNYVYNDIWWKLAYGMILIDRKESLTLQNKQATV